MKDDKPLMTEEQWNEKWDDKEHLSEGKINDYLKRTVAFFKWYLLF